MLPDPLPTRSEGAAPASEPRRSPSLRGVCLGLALLLGVTGVSSARAEAPPPMSPLALTLSGGGTKGAYMAGHLYYVGQASQLGSMPLRPLVFTGASAGAINALLTAFEACAGTTPDPTRSRYWQAWSSGGLEQTFVPRLTTATGLMSTAAFEPIIAQLRALWEAGFPTRCDVVLGVAITRANARMVTLAPSFPALPRSRETVLVRITGQGPGRPPLARNLVDTTRPDADLLLPLDGPEARPFESIIQLVMASAAFPLAFSPVEVRHCLGVPGKPSRCTPAEAHGALFMDGGIFDNQPLGLAARAMRFVRSEGGALVVADTPAPAAALDASFYFLDPRARTFPSGHERPDEVDPKGAVDIVGLLAGMVESSASSALLSVFDEGTVLLDRLLVGRTYFPQISGTFNGLLDRDFRYFDFYLGMYSAARSVREHPLGAQVPDVGASRLADPDPAVSRAWRPFACLRAVLDDEGDIGLCDGEDLTDFRILLQVALDQLADECRTAAANGTPPSETTHRQCAAAMSGATLQIVPGVRKLSAAALERGPSEGLLSYQLRLLGLRGFHFKDLGLARAEAEQAPRRLVQLAHRMTQRFASEQPGSSWALSALSRVAVDLGLGYQPPQHVLHGVLGMGAELGYSVTVNDPDWDWLRFGVALGFDGLSTVFEASDDYLALIPKAGLELELLGQAEFQLRFGLRAGFQLSTADAFTTNACHFDQESRQPCSRLVTEAYLSGSLLGVLRLQLAFVYEPALNSGQDDLVAVRPTLGFQINWPFE